MTHPADLVRLLEDAASRWPEATAWVFDHLGEELTFSDVRRRARAIAAMLRTRGVEPGDRVAVMLDNRPEFPLTWLATAYLGAVMVPVNTAYNDADAAHVLTDSGAVLAVTHGRFVALLDRLRAATKLQTVVSVDCGDGTLGWPAPGTSAVDPSAHPDGAEDAVRAGRPVNIQYTSGTTGRPKGCVLPHRYWTTLASGLIDTHPWLTQGDTILTAQPFHYIDPQWNVATSLASGARLVVLDRFHPTTFWNKVREHDVTWFYCLGLMPALLLEQKPSHQDRRHRVRAVHCSAIPPHLHQSLEQRWGVPWFEAFGMTETGADIRMPPEDHDALVGTSCLGRPLPYREVQVSRPDGTPAHTGETGELTLRGLGMMLGYHDDPDTTAAAFRAGWFHTGDLVRTDPAGRIYHVGRLKESIRRSGENISAAEVEDTLLQHPAVALAAVVPVPDELRGEEVRAFIVPENGQSASPQLIEELANHCRRNLAYFKVPRYWTIRHTLPLTPSERVAKGQLRAEPLGPETYEHHTPRPRHGAPAPDTH